MMLLAICKIVYRVKERICIDLLHKEVAREKGMKGDKKEMERVYMRRMQKRREMNWSEHQ